MKIKFNSINFLRDKNKIIILIGVLLISLQIIYVLQKNEYKEFKIYYAAAKAFLNDDNVYSIENLNKYSSVKIDMPFIYPPISLLFFLPFQVIQFKLSFLFYIASNLISLLFLIKLYKKLIGEERFNFFIILLLFAYNASFLAQIRAGNVTIFEQLFLWIAFLHLGNKKYYLFVLFVLLASVFKLTPLFFVLLLLFLPSKERFKYLMLSFISVIFLIFLNFIFSSDLSLTFLNEVILNRVSKEGSSINPNLYSFINNFLQIVRIKELNIIKTSINIELFIYIILTFVILIVIGRNIKKYSIDQNLILYISSFILVYFLILPRVMFYQHFILVPSLFYILTKVKIHNSLLRYLFLTFIFFPTIDFNRRILGRSEQMVPDSILFLILDYLPLLSLMLGFYILNNHLKKAKSDIILVN